MHIAIICVYVLYTKVASILSIAVYRRPTVAHVLKMCIRCFLIGYSGDKRKLASVMIYLHSTFQFKCLKHADL